MTLDTERLNLSELTHRDAAFVLRLLNEPSFIEQIGDRNVRTLEAARGWIDSGPSASYARLGFGLWRVSLKSGDEPIGICGLLKREGLQDPDLGFALLSPFWSRGYAWEAAQAVKAYARDVIGLRTIAAISLPDNTRSMHLLTKLGFVAVKRVRLSDNDNDLVLLTCDLQAQARMTAGEDAVRKP